MDESHEAQIKLNQNSPVSISPQKLLSVTRNKQMREKATNMTETGHTQFIGPDWVCVLRPHGTVT